MPVASLLEADEVSLDSERGECVVRVLHELQNELQTCTTESRSLLPVNQTTVNATQAYYEMGKETEGWASGPITHGSKSKMH